MKKDIGIEIANAGAFFMREFAKREKVIFSNKALHPSYIILLDILREKGSCSMRELSVALGLTMGAITASIDRLQMLKFVKRERQTRDRRVVKVFLLPAGKTMSLKIFNARQRFIKEVFSVLTEKEKQQYLCILTKVIDGAKKN